MRLGKLSPVSLNATTGTPVGTDAAPDFCVGNTRYGGMLSKVELIMLFTNVELKSNYFNNCNLFRRDFVCTHIDCTGRPVTATDSTRVSEIGSYATVTISQNVK